MGEVDALGCVRQNLDFSAGIIVALFEGGEGGGCLPFQAEGGGDFGPVDLEGCAALEERVC